LYISESGLQRTDGRGETRTTKPRTVGLVHGERPPFFTATIVPTIFGAVFAWHETTSFDTLLFILTLMGVLFLHAGTNVVNDYFDYRSGTDRINIHMCVGILIMVGMIASGLLL